MINTNGYFNQPDDLAPETRARSVDINALKAAANAAFDKLPAEFALKTSTVTFGKNLSTVTNQYSVTLEQAVSVYADGMQVTLMPVLDNTGACTLNVNGIGAIAIRRSDNTTPDAGDILANVPITLTYSLSAGAFFMPIGATQSASQAAKSAAAAAVSAATALAAIATTSGLQSAAGDGVTDDTAAFTALESSKKGGIVNLGGLSYAVTAIPTKNSYVNGTFVLIGARRAATTFKALERTPNKFHAFGGQLKALHASLCNPFEQFTNITFVGDSITWGSGLTENANSSPRNHTLADARDNFASPSFVNEFKRWVGAMYFDGVAPTLSNWAASPSGQSTATYTRTEQLYTNLPPFTIAFVGSANSTESNTPGTLLGYRHRLGVVDNTSSAEISFTFTGKAFNFVYTSVPGSAADYIVTVDGTVLGTYPSNTGSLSNQNRRTHTFPAYIRNKVVKIKAVYPAGAVGVQYLDCEAVEVIKTCTIVNQGIIGTDAREYKANNFGAYGSPVVAADNNYVFIQLGTNDRINTFPNYGQPNGVSTLKSNLNALIASLTAASNPAIVMMAANPAASDNPATYSFGMQAVRDTVFGVAQAASLDMIDNYSIFNNLSTDSFTSDGLHPNLLGHAVIAQNIINAIESA